MREEWTADVVDCGMTFLIQTIKAHDPGAGAIGDCYRTGIACLLGASDPTVVPHFATFPESEKDWGWYRHARIWLRKEFGLDLMSVALDAAMEYGAPYLLSVQSKTGPWSHCVVACGEEVVHDPSGIGGYVMADARDDTADVLCTAYDPEPEEMVRRWVISRDARLEEVACQG